jgi:hypothetical protein
LSLRLADLLGQDRALVLRACGHLRLSENIYSQAPAEMSQPRVQDPIDQLSTNDRRLVQSLIERLSVDTSVAARPLSSSRRTAKGGVR